MFNLYGSTGLGSAGTGETSFGIVPGKALSPDVQAALQQMLNSRLAVLQPAAPGATPPMPGAPMSSLIGAGAPGTAPMSMGGQMVPQPQQPQQPQGIGQALAPPGPQPAGASYNALQLMQILQHLRGSQPQKGIKK